MSVQGHLGYSSNIANFKLQYQKLLFFVFDEMLRLEEEQPKCCEPSMKMNKVKWMLRQNLQKTAPATHIGMAPQKNTFFFIAQADKSMII